MPNVVELSALYENVMLSPRRGPDMCGTCFNFTRGYGQCFACSAAEAWLDVVVPISYSVAHEQLHHALASYKRDAGSSARQIAAGLAAVLWRFLAGHERCIAQAAGVARFPLVTTVPSGDPERDERHPLRRLVGEIVGPTRARHERLLRRTSIAVRTHEFHPEKYEMVSSLTGEAVLLVDDTWTTGASAQSAAAALKAAGTGQVAAVVIGRHLNRSWHENDRRLRGIGGPFDWKRCVLGCGDRPIEEPASGGPISIRRSPTPSLTPPRSCR